MEDLRVVCDQCGGRFIHHRRKYALPTREVKLTDWTLEIQTPKTEPGVLQATEMVAECSDCHFTVEYSRMSI